MKTGKKTDKVENLVRPLVRKLHPYTPGEQPKIEGLVKLNTNENPYPPSPIVLDAIKAATDARLRLYPNPTAQPLREKLARLHGCAPENIIVGNGSDELLAMAVRAFVEPANAVPSSKKARATVQFFNPSYSLYPVLADIHGAISNPVPLGRDFALPGLDELAAGKKWISNAALTFITTPNAPTGRGYSTAQLEAICRAQSGVVVLDEAYVDFSSEDAMELALRLPNVIVSRTFSKAYCLCFQRVGYFVGHPVLIGALHKIRDSYNVNGLGQIAAMATLDDLPYYRRNFLKVIATRERLTAALSQLQFKVFPSRTNFIFVQPPVYPASEWLERLREHRILVRWWSAPEVRNFLRISIGTDAETTSLIKAVNAILQHKG